MHGEQFGLERIPGRRSTVGFGSTAVGSARSRSAENAPESGPYGWISFVAPAFRRLFATSLDSVLCQILPLQDFQITEA